MSRYQKGKTNLDFTEARDNEWQLHQLGHMQVCTLLQTDNHASTPLLSFLQAGRPSCRPTNSVRALKAIVFLHYLAKLKIQITPFHFNAEWLTNTQKQQNYHLFTERLSFTGIF